MKIRRHGERAVAAMAGLMLAACATSPGADELSWYYRTSYVSGEPERPIGLYGLPETSPDYVLECAPQERSIHFVSIDIVFEGSRPIAIAAGRARWTGTEHADPPDVYATSRAVIPLSSPVWDAVERGRPIHIIGPDGTGVLEGGPIPARVVRECREASADG